MQPDDDTEQARLNLPHWGDACGHILFSRFIRVLKEDEHRGVPDSVLG